MADTQANRKAFGDPPSGRYGSGRYLQIRVLTLIAGGTRAILDAVWGPWSTGELPLMDKLMRTGTIRPGMLVLADRYFTGYLQVSQIIAAGAHLVFRTPSRRTLPVMTELTVDIDSEASLYRRCGCQQFTRAGDVTLKASLVRATRPDFERVRNDREIN